jgi:hypothetical protein
LIKDRKLVNDFILRAHDQDGSKVLHILNLNSPGWTSAFPFADRIVSHLLDIDEDEISKFKLI